MKNKITKFLLKSFGVSNKIHSDLITEEVVKDIIEISEEEGAINKTEREFINNVLEFDDLTVFDVMVSKENIEYKNHPISGSEVLKIAENYPWIETLKLLDSLAQDLTYYNPSLDFTCLENRISFCKNYNFPPEIKTSIDSAYGIHSFYIKNYIQG